MKIVKRGSSALHSGKVVQRRGLESPSGWSLRTLQRGRVVLGKVVACTGHLRICPVAAGAQGVGA